MNTRMESKLRCSMSTSRISAGSLSRAPRSWMVLRLTWLVLGSEYCRMYRFCSRVDLLNSSWSELRHETVKRPQHLGKNSHFACCPTLHFTSFIVAQAHVDLETGRFQSKVDTFSQWTRPNIGLKEYYLDDQKGVRKSIRITATYRRKTTDLAGFAKLPLELFEDIILGLDLISFVRLSATNSAFRNLLCERPEFANTIAFAPHVVRAICKLGVRQ
ncbi:hypothetical protein KVT40_003837 [Elsinoe batatas]|uniref:F-box domain-containing protein n=1 Tax=Elsinoe batatas TaxID=2601811 RepID=A0A8K0L1H8_9PEZI|nr:hypothetical protein KVT40_003837 [Elsinoe batatas]